MSSHRPSPHLLPALDRPSVDVARIGRHLSGEQMSAMLASSPRREPLPETNASEAHLRVCSVCAAEFDSLREALNLFREATSTFTARELARLKPMARPAFPVLPAQPAYSQTLFWIAASAILIAGILPLELRWQRKPPVPPAAAADSSAIAARPAARTAESDEALLADIDRELSASVPAPMQALSDPVQETAGSGAQTASPVSETSPERRD